MKIAVIGSGNVGGTLGQAWVRAGHTVVFGRRSGAQEPAISGAKSASIADAVRNAEVVVLAVPWAAVPEVIEAAGSWSGKILVDCTNPIGPGFELAVGLNTSGGEEVARLAKGARVAKAFNTTGSGNMANPHYKAGSISMLFCTDDAGAQQATEQLIRDVGFDPVFAGPLKLARYFESLAMLWISMTRQIGHDFAFNVVRR